ncbi:MAG: glycosyltransferase family 4 protein [Nitrospira sp.]|nr:glycosyltransferase family 4 protein [Nitrospira sp.]MDH4368708.1 glycosyltransferase family 4 protein [Nitrospira sp.]MDH5348954.1 glycosyltransferase family 4 protein [Nitrospira sp.]MDH5496810.1 glycosyltransferase family 4 protein [Nitrospira sp.]
MKSSPRILFLVTEDWYFWLHWLDLARATRDAGFEVLLATRIQEHGQQISQQGFKLFPISLLRRSLNPIRELLAVWELVRLYRSEKPDIVYHIAVKPIFYGSIAARLTGIRHVINVFAGLGYAYTSNSINARLLRLFLRVGLRAAFAREGSVAVFQNEEDRAQLTHDRIVEEIRARVIPGTGVDIDKFQPTHDKAQESIVLLACRMLWDKGVGEFVEAARLVRQLNLSARFVLVGRCDDDNPASIGLMQLQRWQEEGVVEWWGHRDDMPMVFSRAAVVVLPSYREGLPVSLLEAAACGKPIVASDVPGCREVVRHRVNGLLVQPRNASALADAVTMLLENEGLRVELGRSGREIVVKEFSAAAVISQTLGLYRELLYGTTQAR